MLNWNLLVERRILAAMERGEFDHLPGQGQPLAWPENPFVPPDWRLTFHLLEQAGLAPEWIMRDAEIRADLAALEGRRERERLWMEERRAALADMFPAARAAERVRLRQVQECTWERVEQFVARLNRRIADFNLVVPIARLQRRPLDPVREQTALREAWGTLDLEETA